MIRPRWNDKAERVLEGARFDVWRVGYPRRSGGEQPREVVEPADAVVILPMLSDGRIILIRNERFAVNETLWELPAGTLEEHEDPGACAVRELAEETGYRAGRLEPLTRFYTTPGFCTERMHAYRATGMSEGNPSLEETERIEVEPVTPEQAASMVRDGRIQDAKTAMVLLFELHFGGTAR